MIQHLCLLIASTVVVSLLSPSRCEALERVHLKSGQTREGISVDVVDETLKWLGPDGKMVSIPLEEVATIEYLDDDEPLENVTEATGSYTLTDPAKVVDPPAAVEIAREAAADVSLPPDIAASNDSHWQQFCDWSCDSFDAWTHRLELGARVLRGNSVEEYVNLGGKFENQTEHRLTQFDFSGQYGRNRGVVASNRWIANSNTDFNREGNWIVFVTTKNEYDEFENLDYRGTLSSGLGYRFINEPDRRIITRVGPGVTYEKFDNPTNERVTPDLFTELETLWPIGPASYEHRTTAHPSIEDFGLIRIVSSHGLLFKLDNDGKWKFKVDFRYEYNSQPNPGRLKSDYTTNLSIVYTRK